MNPICRKPCARAAASFIFCVWAIDNAGGFSQNTDLPRPMAATARSVWGSVGLTMTAASIPGSSSIAKASGYHRGTSRSRAVSSASLAFVSTKAARRTPATRPAKSRAYTRPSRPSPIKPTFNFIFSPLRDSTSCHVRDDQTPKDHMRLPPGSSTENEISIFAEYRLPLCLASPFGYTALSLIRLGDAEFEDSGLEYSHRAVKENWRPSLDVSPLIVRPQIQE